MKQRQSELSGQAICAVESRAEERELPKMSEAQKIVAESLKSDIELQDFSYNARLCFLLKCCCFCALVLPSLNNKEFNFKKIIL